MNTIISNYKDLFNNEAIKINNVTDNFKPSNLTFIKLDYKLIPLKDINIVNNLDTHYRCVEGWKVYDYMLANSPISYIVYIKTILVDNNLKLWTGYNQVSYMIDSDYEPIYKIGDSACINYNGKIKDLNICYATLRPFYL